MKAQPRRSLRRRGEDCPASKLTERDVRAIRLAVTHRTKHTGTFTQLAEQFGISRQQVYNIVHGLCWSHVH